MYTACISLYYRVAVIRAPLQGLCYAAQWKAINFASDDELSKAAVRCNSKTRSVETGFTDVPAAADYARAVTWAVEECVTTGPPPPPFPAKSRMFPAPGAYTWTITG